MPLLFDFDNDGALDLFLAPPAGLGALAQRRHRLVLARRSARFRRRRRRRGRRLRRRRRSRSRARDAGGRARVSSRTDGGNANGWIDVALEGLPTGSAKVNRFGYGSEIEVKARDLYVFRTASRPVTHLGLGARRRADVLRVVWTNGVPQNALDPPARTLVQGGAAAQGLLPVPLRLRRTALELRHRRARPRVPSGLLYDGVHQARGGHARVARRPGRRCSRRPRAASRSTSPRSSGRPSTSISPSFARSTIQRASRSCPNEKMVPPPFPAKTLYTIARPLVPRATDETRPRPHGGDRARGRRATSRGFAPTRYQGIVAPHALVLELPEARRGGTRHAVSDRLDLLRDTSINVSLSQGRDVSRRRRRRSRCRTGAEAGRSRSRRWAIRPGRPRRCRSTCRTSSTGRTRACASGRTSRSTGIGSPTRWTRSPRRSPDRRAPLASARLFFRGFSRDGARVAGRPAGLRPRRRANRRRAGPTWPASTRASAT